MVLAKRAAAKLAAKEAEFEVLQQEKKLKEKIQLLEEKQRWDLNAQKDELERLHAEKEIKAARARLEVYIQEAGYVKQESVCSSSVKQTPNNKPSSPPNADVSYLAQAVQDSMTLNRLSMPEPTFFNGDPIHFIE